MLGVKEMAVNRLHGRLSEPATAEGGKRSSNTLDQHTRIVALCRHHHELVFVPSRCHSL